MSRSPDRAALGLRSRTLLVALVTMLQVGLSGIYIYIVVEETLFRGGGRGVVATLLVLMIVVVDLYLIQALFALVEEESDPTQGASE